MITLRRDWALAGRARRNRRRRSGEWRATSGERDLRHVFLSADAQEFRSERSAARNRRRGEGGAAACRVIPHPHIFVSADSKELTAATSLSRDSKGLSARPFRWSAEATVREAGIGHSPCCGGESAKADEDTRDKSDPFRPTVTRDDRKGRHPQAVRQSVRKLLKTERISAIPWRR